MTTKWFITLERGNFGDFDSQQRGKLIHNNVGNFGTSRWLL